MERSFRTSMKLNSNYFPLQLRWNYHWQRGIDAFFVEIDAFHVQIDAFHAKIDISYAEIVASYAEIDAGCTE